MEFEIRIKRACDAAPESDGARILVDRLWPRGLSRDKAKLDEWDKAIAPSPEVRKAYHASGDYEKFTEACVKEPDANEKTGEFLSKARAFLQKGPLTPVFGSKDPSHSNAQVLKEYLEEHL